MFQAAEKRVPLKSHLLEDFSKSLFFFPFFCMQIGREKLLGMSLQLLSRLCSWVWMSHLNNLTKAYHGFCCWWKQLTSFNIWTQINFLPRRSKFNPGLPQYTYIYNRCYRSSIVIIYITSPHQYYISQKY